MRVLALLVVVWRCAQDVTQAELDLTQLNNKVAVMEEDFFAQLDVMEQAFVSQTAEQQTQVDNLKTLTSQLSRQLLLERLYAEEASRSSGDSGLKQIRMRASGSKAYYVESHTGSNIAAIHEHADHNNTLGMGELIAVLNGVHFRTRHNDYQLRKPSTTDPSFNAEEHIPYPDVPPAVLAKTDINEQIAEMREWFAAWRVQNHTVRDYRPYFRAHLSYLEGAWIKSATLSEPFASDRHTLEADSWHELQDQIRYSGETGYKHANENFAWLPNKVMGVENGLPVFGQYSYRIMMHPLKDDFELKDFTVVDNLAYRVSRQRTMDQYVQTRSARFTVNPRNPDVAYRFTKMDELMFEIPGRDNYMADITDDQMGLNNTDVWEGKPLNTGFYHHWYKTVSRDAMGESMMSRGFNDRNLFMAETTQEEVVPVSMLYCKDEKARRRNECHTVSKRFTTAIPLEIVFTTPLNSWNPYGLQYKGEQASDEGKTVKLGIRNGGHTVDTAYNGTSSKAYFLTPAEFYEDTPVGSEHLADTAIRQSVGVLDQSGVVKSVVASGVPIFTRDIPGVGMLRTRYPVMPVHEEGSAVWKELEPLRDIVMDLQAHSKLLTIAPNLSPAPPPDPPIAMRTSYSSNTTGAQHYHTFSITAADDERIRADQKEVVLLNTEQASGHTHLLRIKYWQNAGEYRIVTCDTGTATDEKICWDHHSIWLTVDPTEE